MATDLREDLCAHDPTLLDGEAVGMYHCPECGEMVVAGIPHPDYSLLAAPEWLEGAMAPTEEQLRDELVVQLARFIRAAGTHWGHKADGGCRGCYRPAGHAPLCPVPKINELMIELMPF